MTILLGISIASAVVALAVAIVNAQARPERDFLQFAAVLAFLLSIVTGVVNAYNEGTRAERVEKERAIASKDAESAKESLKGITNELGTVKTLNQELRKEIATSKGQLDQLEARLLTENRRSGELERELAYLKGEVNKFTDAKDKIIHQMEALGSVIPDAKEKLKPLDDAIKNANDILKRVKL